MSEPDLWETRYRCAMDRCNKMHAELARLREAARAVLLDMEETHRMARWQWNPDICERVEVPCKADCETCRDNKALRAELGEE